MKVANFDFSHYIRKPPKLVLIFSGRESYTMTRKIAPGLLNSIRDITRGIVVAYVYIYIHMYIYVCVYIYTHIQNTFVCA